MPIYGPKSPSYIDRLMDIHCRQSGRKIIDGVSNDTKFYKLPELSVI
jgi:hypothetical protein